jgi:FAD/FMN-containing dehydrogenase
MAAAMPGLAERTSTPPGIAREDSAAALSAFAADTDTASQHMPRAILKPNSTEQVLELLQWANGSGAAVVPVSSTGRRRRGDTVPQVDAAIIADLSGMNRLLHADSRDKISIIEPGVDFASIDRLLLPHGLRAFRPLAPRAGKSVIASYLEREPLIAANDHWDVADPFGGTHLVLGNGQSMPTGTAGSELPLQQQLSLGHRQMVPVGPTNIDPLRVIQGAQGTLGIMSWAAIYCERIPSAETAWFCPASALEPLQHLARDIVHRRLGNAVFIVDQVQLAMLLARNRDTFQRLRRQLPAWTLVVSAGAGSQRADEKLAWQRADVERIALAHGSTACAELEGYRSTDLLHGLRQAEPLSFRDRPMGAHRELFFMHQLDRIGPFEPLVRETLGQAGFGDWPLGVYVQPMAQGVNCHLEFTLPYDPQDRALAARLDEAWHLAARRCAEAGGFFSRPYGRWTEFAFGRDIGARTMLRMAKSLFDPRHVMNPSRLPY